MKFESGDVYYAFSCGKIYVYLLLEKSNILAKDNDIIHGWYWYVLDLVNGRETMTIDNMFESSNWYKLE